MAFNGLGFGTMGPGATQTWRIWLGGATDQGGQIIHAHPETPGSIMTDGQTKIRHDDGSFEYDVTVHNLDTARAVSFSFQGGGMV